MSDASFLTRVRPLIETALERILPGPALAPTTLHQAMRYSVFAGGKRLRPALALAAADLAGMAPATIADAAAALELIHTYSLVHDDLPAMDDDDLRRGNPTCHIVFGDAVAILAGDALLTLAFAVLAAEPAAIEFAPRRPRAIRRVAIAAGASGMVGGQVADLEATAAAPAASLRTELAFIHARKTGALMGASVALGATLAGLAESEVDRLDEFGRTLGLAFQIADDVLDVEGSAQVLGKTAGKDARAKKLTYPALYGLEASKLEAARCLAAAESSLEPWGKRAAALLSLTRAIAARRS